MYFFFVNKRTFLVSIHLRLHFETSWEAGERLLKKETNLNLFIICFLLANALKQTLNNAYRMGKRGDRKSKGER